jgi:hypothetical protein
LSIINPGRADPVDGITGEEDQKLDENETNERLRVAERQRDSLARRLAERYQQLEEARTALEWMTQERDAYQAEAESLTDQLGDMRAGLSAAEADRDVAYRAGREDAARDLRTAVRLIGTECENFRSGTCVDSGRTPDARYTADRWCDHCILREALAGDGVQPTEEQPDE